MMFMKITPTGKINNQYCPNKFQLSLHQNDQSSDDAKPLHLREFFLPMSPSSRGTTLLVQETNSWSELLQPHSPKNSTLILKNKNKIFFFFYMYLFGY